MNAFGAMVWNGFREARRNRVTVVVAAFTAIVLLSTTLVNEVTVNTFYRVLTDFGLGMMSLILVFLAIFLSTGLLSREIERRTIFLIVSKPVSRTSFLLARLGGNMLTLGILLAAMSGIFLLQLVVLGVSVTSIQLIAIAGLFLELLVLTSLGFLFSSFSGPIVSAMIVVGLYFTGHLSGDIYALATRSESGIIRAVGKAVYYTLPNLERFNFRPMAAYQVPVGWGELATSIGYGLGWSAVFCAIAAFLFNRRDFR